ncbi:MAG: hypothetical protein JSW06_03075 [Thermoplasmatales archaeon]|nr:MAG: hypothetical protein JSW06_03075 [Thermoplasmatales archaeon]
MNELEIEIEVKKIKRHKPPVATKLIRVHRAIAEDLDVLRTGPYCKLSYNDVIYLLLRDTDAIKRKQICNHWIKYGHRNELEYLMKQLDKIWRERYNGEEYPISLGDVEK